MALEALELRLFLDSYGVINGNDVYLTLSFAEDGTDAAGQSSALAATFDSIAPTAAWQDAILRAFQTWAKETNADIGLVADNGDAFGSAGPNQDDDRFGDIRIGAIAMSPEVGAVSVPVDGLVSGTWYADVLFNTSYNYTSLEDIFAVALHEAGNVFGLEDNSDPTSPLFTGGAPTGLPPTANDLAELQALYGSRMSDANEIHDGQSNNDSFATATSLKLVESGNGNEGTAPSIVYGDITNDLDRDFFSIKIPGDYNNDSVTIQIRSDGISLLAYTLNLYDSNQQLISQTVSTSSRGDSHSIVIPSVESDQTYYVEVTGGTPGLFSVGGYSLVAVFDGINQVSQSTIDSVAGGQYRFLGQDDLGRFFDDIEDEHFGDDLHSDDTPLTATELITTNGFTNGTRYEIVASIADDTDVDYYKFQSPEAAAGPFDVITVLVRSLDTGGLVPTATIYDKDGLVVNSTVLANGAGDYIIQFDGTDFGENYQVKVEAAHSTGPFRTGNYSLAVTFGSQPTQLISMAAGVVGNTTTQNIHTLYAGRPQLVHLALQVDETPVTSPTVLVATIRDSNNATVYEIASVPGETRSREAVFLAAGAYTVEIVPLTLDGSIPPALSYSLLGAAISDPFVGDPDDPTNNPFACTEPGMEGFFCYPGGLVSPDPFLWDDFISQLTDPPPELGLPSLITLLFGDWWSWVWNQAGVNGPPFGMPDATHQGDTPTSAIAPLVLGVSGSVLDNDIDPEGGPLVALLKTGPAHGILDLASDGTFTYTPSVGFRGRDEFSYSAFDFMQESSPTTVSIIVGVSGDFTANGQISGFDFLSWQQNFGTSSGATLIEGDGDFDGDVDAQDLNQWEQQLGLVASNGDADDDGDYDGFDFLAWQLGFGASAGATNLQGDADADTDVDSHDLLTWETHFGSTVALPLFAAVQSTSAAISSAQEATTEANPASRVQNAFDYNPANEPSGVSSIKMGSEEVHAAVLPQHVFLESPYLKDIKQGTQRDLGSNSHRELRDIALQYDALGRRGFSWTGHLEGPDAIVSSQDARARNHVHDEVFAELGFTRSSRFQSALEKAIELISDSPYLS